MGQKWTKLSKNNNFLTTFDIKKLFVLYAKWIGWPVLTWFGYRILKKIPQAYCTFFLALKKIKWRRTFCWNLEMTFFPRCLPTSKRLGNTHQDNVVVIRIWPKYVTESKNKIKRKTNNTGFRPVSRLLWRVVLKPGFCFLVVN